MPVYDYQCEECGQVFERFVLSGKEEVACPGCKGSTHKLLSTFSVQVPDEACGKLPRGEQRELCTECRSGGAACPLTA